MKTTFTRRELIHEAIELIRIYLGLYEDKQEIKYIDAAYKVTSTLNYLGVISTGKCYLLHDIIGNEYRRLLKKQKVLCQTADRTIKKPS